MTSNTSLKKDRINPSKTALPGGLWHLFFLMVPYFQLGLAAVICACFSSGFAGAYFEKLVKQGVQVSDS